VEIKKQILCKIQIIALISKEMYHGFT